MNVIMDHMPLGLGVESLSENASGSETQVCAYTYQLGINNEQKDVTE